MFVFNRLKNILKKNRSISALILFFFLVNFFIYRSLLVEGYVINRDFTRVQNLNRFLQDFIPVWNEHGSFSNIFRISKFLIYIPLFFISLLKIEAQLTHIFFTYFTLLGTLSAVSVYLLSKYLLFQQNREPLSSWKKISCVSAAVFYTFSTYSVEHVTHPAIKYGFYLAPLILLTLIVGVNEDKKKYTVLSALLWSLAMSDLHWLIFGAFVLFAYIAYNTLWEIVRGNKKIHFFRKNLKHFIILFSTFLLLNSYYIVLITFSATSSFAPTLLVEEISWLYHNANMTNLFAMKSNLFLDSRYGSLPSFLSFLQGINLNVFLIILTVTGLSSLLICRRKTKEHLFFGLLYVTAFFLSAGPNISPTVFYWFMFKAPFSSVYAWAFRTSKFHQFLILALTPLIAFTGAEVSHRIKFFLKRYDKTLLKMKPARTISLFFLVIVLSLSLISNYPLLTGDFNGNLNTNQIPPEYEDAITYLTAKEGNFKVIWGPPYNSLKSQWSHNPIGDFTNDISPTPNLDSWLNDIVLFGIRYNYNSLTYYRNNFDLEKFYSPLNVRYIIIHNDIPALNSKTEKIIEILDSQNGLEKVKKYGWISIYEIKNISDPITIMEKSLVIEGGLLKYDSLSNIAGFKPSKIGVIYSDNIDSSNILDYSDIIVTDRKIDLIPNQCLIIAPYENTFHQDPINLWSKSDIRSAFFRNRLVNMNLLSNYQFDYGKGLVFTWANNTILNNAFYIDEPEDYIVSIRYFGNTEGGMINVYLDNEQITIQTKDRLNKFYWKDLGTFHLDKGKHVITLENINGFNAVNLITLKNVKETNELEERVIDLIKDKRIIYILEAKTDMYGENTVQSNINGKILKLNPTSKVWNDIEIIKPGNYTIGVKGKGNLNITIDGNEYVINSTKFDWTYLSSVYLRYGKHEIEIKSSSSHIAQRSVKNTPELGEIWIFSTKKEEETIEDIFISQEKIAEIIAYKKIDATKYVIEVNASKPFMLSLAESYDPSWVTWISGEKITPIPLYSAINGFWINKTGKLNITIVYEPQGWVYYLLTISMMTVIGSMVYFVWDWKTKNNTPISWLHNKLRRLWRKKS